MARASWPCRPELCGGSSGGRAGADSARAGFVECAGKKYAASKIPALLIYGEDDTVVALDEMNALAGILMRPFISMKMPVIRRIKDLPEGLSKMLCHFYETAAVCEWWSPLRR
ncbi:MAG: hypothetical protein R2861_05370 [Desulfobacterales bacterium]